jgi:glycosyltransferase involved in cell wall biosynthesis
MESNLNQPFFSIAIPTYGYNGKGVEFLEHNLNILFKQKFTDFEIVISDHSVDDTIFEVLKKYPTIKYVKCEHGRGVISPNLNNAIKNCSGKWIKILFQDDFLMDEDALLTQYDVLDSVSDVKWLVTSFMHSNDGINYYRPYLPKYSEDIWTGNNTLGNPSNLTIKNEDLIYFDEELNWLVDCEYYYRLFLKFGKPTILTSFTVVNRTHGGGLTDSTPQRIKNKELNMLIRKYATTT